MNLLLPFSLGYSVCYNVGLFFLPASEGRVKYLLFRSSALTAGLHTAGLHSENARDDDTTIDR
jgi:hypothetical protein